LSSFGHSYTHENRINTVFSSFHYGGGLNLGAVVLLKLAPPFPFSSSSGSCDDNKIRNPEFVVNNKIAPIIDENNEKIELTEKTLSELDEKVFLLLLLLLLWLILLFLLFLLFILITLFLLFD
jgi:hypothetical protein